MPSSQSVNHMDFFHDDVLISTSQPPEEIVACIAGGCGMWQFVITAISVVAQLFHSMDNLAVKFSAPTLDNFTCLDDNGTDCMLFNGTACKNYKFFKNHSITTFTEQLTLICDEGHYPLWLRSSYMLGLFVGYVVTGCCADKIGIKFTSFIFVSLFSLTGLITISMTNIEILFFFMLTHGMFSSVLNLIPILAVCDAVGNRSRTLALGTLSISLPARYVIFPLILNLFTDSLGAVAAASIAPILLLIPLLYFKDSPNYICLMTDYSKSEEIVRAIARFNKCPMAPNLKIRPVQLTLDSNIPKRSSFLDLWRPSVTRRAYISFFTMSFCMAYSNTLLWENTYPRIEDMLTSGIIALFGCTLSVALCHWLPHKTVVAIFEFLKNAFIGTMLVYASTGQEGTSSLFYLRMASSLFMWTSLTAIINLAPRIFPTELRGTGCGTCFSIGPFGLFIGFVVFTYTDHSLYVAGPLLVVATIVAIVGSFALWNVHNRELPDFLSDCVRFSKYYKPTRYYTIYDTASQHEIEVKLVDLNKLDPKPQPSATYPLRR